MAAVAPSVTPSLAAAYTPADVWLVQAADPAGKDPVTTGPSEPISNPVDGTAPVPLTPPPGGFAEGPLQFPDYLLESSSPHAGPWPALPEEGQGKEPLGTLVSDGITPIGSFKIPPKIEGLAQTKALLPGHDAHSQDTDTAGWDQYTPTGRTAIRQGWLQNYLGVDYYWPVTQPNLARTRTAVGANQNVGGVVAQYGGLADSGGNTAYEAASPPAVTTQQPVTGAGSFPQWGF